MFEYAKDARARLSNDDRAFFDSLTRTTTAPVIIVDSRGNASLETIRKQPDYGRNQSPAAA